MFSDLRRWLKNYDRRMAGRRNKAVKENKGENFALQYDMHYLAYFNDIYFHIHEIKRVISQLRKLEKRYKNQELLDKPPKNKLAGRNSITPNQA